MCSKLVDKANINLAIFELVGNKDEFVKLLAEALREFYAGSKAIKT